jgi:hypothetical protein
MPGRQFVKGGDIHRRSLNVVGVDGVASRSYELKEGVEFLAKYKDRTAAAREAMKGSTNSATDAVEARVVAFAEQLGRIVGTVQGKADGWLDSQTLTDQLKRIRDEASDLLDHFGGETASVAATPVQKRTTANTPRRSARVTTTPSATAASARSGGTVDAPGKRHRKPPPSTRGIKHSDEMIPKLNAAQAMRHRRRG